MTWGLVLDLYLVTFDDVDVGIWFWFLLYMELIFNFSPIWQSRDICLVLVSFNDVEEWGQYLILVPFYDMGFGI